MMDSLSKACTQLKQASGARATTTTTTTARGAGGALGAGGGGGGEGLGLSRPVTSVLPCRHRGETLTGVRSSMMRSVAGSWGRASL